MGDVGGVGAPRLHGSVSPVLMGAAGKPSPVLDAEDVRREAFVDYLFFSFVLNLIISDFVNMVKLMQWPLISYSLSLLLSVPFPSPSSLPPSPHSIFISP